MEYRYRNYFVFAYFSLTLLSCNFGVSEDIDSVPADLFSERLEEVFAHVDDHGSARLTFTDENGKRHEVELVKLPSGELAPVSSVTIRLLEEAFVLNSRRYTESEFEEALFNELKNRGVVILARPYKFKKERFIRLMNTFSRLGVKNVTLGFWDE